MNKQSLVFTYARSESGGESLLAAIVDNKVEEESYQSIPQSAHVIFVRQNEVWNDATLDFIIPKLIKQLDENHPHVDSSTWKDTCQLIIDSNLHQYCRQANFIINSHGDKAVGGVYGRDIRFLGVASAHEKLATKFIKKEKITISSDLAGNMPSSLPEDDLGVCFALLAAYLRMIPDDSSAYWNALEAMAFPSKK